MNSNTTLHSQTMLAAEGSLQSDRDLAPFFVLPETAYAAILHDEQAAKEARKGGDSELADAILAGISRRYPQR